MMLNEQNTRMEFRKTLINLIDKFTYFRNAVTNHFTCSDSFCSDRYAVIHFGLCLRHIRTNFSQDALFH